MEKQIKMLGNIDAVKSIFYLEKDYEESKNFFKHVMESERTKVIAAGRTYILYRIYKSILEEEGCVEKGKTYTTDAISQIPKLDGELLLVQDIITNAYDTNEYIKKIISRNIVKEENIIIWCDKIWKNCRMWEDIKRYLRHRMVVVSTKRKILDIRFDDVVVYANVGNSSLVNSYRIKDKWAYLIKEAKTTWIDNKTFRIVSEVIYEDFLPGDVIDNYNIKSCVRVSRTVDSLQVTPYVFLPQLYADKAYAYCKSLLAKLDLNYPAYFDENEDIELFYKWTIAAVSKKVFENFAERNSITEVEVFDCSKETFGLNDETKFKKAIFTEFDISDAIVNSKKYEITNFATNQFRGFLTREKDLKVGINSYIDFMRKEEVELSYTGVEKSSHTGLRVNTIFDMMGSIPFSEKELISELVESLAFNKLTYFIEEEAISDNKKIVGEVFRCGSHAFYVHYGELYKNATVAFKIFFDKKVELRLEKLSSFAMYMDSYYKTSEFSEFVETLSIEEYYSDMRAVCIETQNAKFPFMERKVDQFIEITYPKD